MKKNIGMLQVASYRRYAVEFLTIYVDKNTRMYLNCCNVVSNKLNQK